jgi:PAS domain S-box-containing protein
LIAALALRRFVADPLRLRNTRDFVLYGLIAIALVPAVMALGGAGARFALGYDFWAAWRQWFLGNALANLIVTPAILYGIPDLSRALKDSRRKRWFEALFVATGLIIASYFAFQSPARAGGFAELEFYAPVPFLFWAAFRFGMLGASGAIVIISMISVGAAVGGHGPFAGGSPNDTALALQEFLLFRAAPLYLVAILIERKRAADDGLVRSEQRYREVVESQAELVCRFLADGTLSFVSEAFCRAFQRTRHALLGSDFIALLDERARDTARAQIGLATLHEERAEWECQVTLPDGNIGWQHWLCHPVVQTGTQIAEFQAIGRDITDRKHAEEADRNLAHASRLAVVGELTAMMAHEINQPLGAILSNADAAEMLLASTDPPLEEIREILSAIRRNDLRASETILRIRALLRKEEIRLRPIDINATILDVLRLLSPDMMRRQISLLSELDPSLPPVFADRISLQQVLLNLFVNAMDAMKETPVTRRLLLVSTRGGAGDAIEVTVADRGHGIAPDNLSDIFESFVTTKNDGMGLGLSIARSIVKSHQGRIWAENGVDGGATFHFTVKVAREAA